MAAKSIAAIPAESIPFIGVAVIVDGEVADNVNQVTAAIAELFAEIRPHVVITWGPEGGYGHKDHRLVSAIVAGLFQAGVEGSPLAVYFPGIPRFQVESWTAISGLGAGLRALWGTTDEKYLQFQVPVSYEDIFATYTAADCHTSQWNEDALVDIGALLAIEFVTIGVGIGVYGKLILGNDPAPFSMVFLAIEIVAVGCSITYLLKSNEKT